MDGVSTVTRHTQHSSSRPTLTDKENVQPLSKKNKKQFKNLKKSLQSHFPNYTSKDIDKLFDEMDINENVNITKDLLNAITEYMSIN